jgi:uncharacterized protein YceH (UPF0502 family)
MTSTPKPRVTECLAISHYEQLSPARRVFVDFVAAGEVPTQAMRRMRPNLKRPDCRASEWMARVDIQAAIAERQGQVPERPRPQLEARVAELELRMARLTRLLEQLLAREP